MTSARMLIPIVAVAGLGLAGCMEPSFGIAPPRRVAQPGDVTGPNVHVDDPNNPAAGEAASGAQGEASNDPEVQALTNQIEALTKRPGAGSSEAATQRPTNVGSEASTSAKAPASAPAAAAEQQQASNAAGQARMEPGLRLANASAERAADAVEPPAPALADIAASPAPVQTPSIEPSAASVQSPTASANVGVEIVDVRPALSAMTAPPVTLPTASPNQPSRSGPPQQSANLNTIIGEMEKAMQQQPPNPQDEFRLRLLYLAAGMDEKSSAPLTGMDPVQTELLTAIVKTVASTRKAMQQPTDSSTAALSSVEELRRLLAQQSGVSIARLALVTKVTSFGDYDVINPLRFKQGSEIHAYVYTEISNFKSEPVDGERLRTMVSEQVQVFDAAGKTVWERNEPKIEDIVRTPRRDFFIPFPVHLPANLPSGDYVVKVSIEDRVGGTTDQQRLSFSVQ